MVGLSKEWALIDPWIVIISCFVVCTLSKISHVADCHFKWSAVHPVQVCGTCLKACVSVIWLWGIIRYVPLSHMVSKAVGPQCQCSNILSLTITKVSLLPCLRMSTFEFSCYSITFCPFGWVPVPLHGITSSNELLCPAAGVVVGVCHLLGWWWFFHIRKVGWSSFWLFALVYIFLLSCP